jgi:hypothetical protein
VNSPKDYGATAYPDISANRHRVLRHFGAVTDPCRKGHRYANLVQSVVIPSNDLDASADEAVITDLTINLDHGALPDRNVMAN